jgi:hypothetical protein
MALRNSYPRFPHRGLRLITGPTVEPVVAAELRNFLKTDAATLGDSEADLLISQARNFLEEESGIAFNTQTWEVAFDTWPGHAEPWWDGVRELPVTELYSGPARAIELPRYPLIALTSVKTYSENSTETVVVVADTFNVDVVSRPGRMSLKQGLTWPIATREINAIVMQFTAGFGPLSTDIPAILRSAVLNLAGYYHDHQGECDMRQAAKMSGAMDMLSSYRVARL